MFDKNIDNFIKPISKQLPCGIDLNASGKISWLRDMRLELQKQHDDNNAEWVSQQSITLTQQDFVNICEDLLKSDSKDLTVVVFYIEALFKIDSISGLSHGLNILLALCENYWNSLYPEFFQDDPEMRAIPFKLLQTSLVKMFLSYELKVGVNEVISLSQVVDETNSIQLNQIKQKIETSLAKHSMQELHVQIENFHNIKEILEKITEFTNLLEQEEIDLFLCEKYFNQVLKLYQAACDKKDNSLNASVTDVIASIEQNINTKEYENNSLKVSNSQNLQQIQTENLISSQINSYEDAYLLMERANNYLLSQDPQAIVPNLLQKTLNYRHLSLAQVLSELMEISKDSTSFLKHFSEKSIGD